MTNPIFSINASTLKAIAKYCRLIGKVSFDLLNYMWAYVSDNGVTFVSSSMENYWIEVEVSNPAQVFVYPQRPLSAVGLYMDNIIKDFGILDDEVLVYPSEVYNGDRRVTIKTERDGDINWNPMHIGGIIGSTPFEKKELISKCGQFVSQDDCREEFTYLEVAGGHIVSTDGHRLSDYDANIPQGITRHIPYLTLSRIIPKLNIQCLEYYEQGAAFRAIDNKEGLNIRVSFRERAIRFPDFSKIFYGNPAGTIHISDACIKQLRAIPKSHLKESIKTVLRYRKEDNTLMAYRNSKDITPEEGCLFIEKDVSTRGTVCTIGFSAKYLLDVAEANDWKEFDITVLDEDSPGIITAFNGNRTWRHILMGVQL